jgi:two-component system cell cycle response regulator
MPETDLSAAALAAERLRRRIASDPFPIQRGKQAMEVTSISVGIAALAEGEDPASVLKRADEALYRAKRDGRNRVVPAAA